MRTTNAVNCQLGCLSGPQSADQYQHCRLLMKMGLSALPLSAAQTLSISIGDPSCAKNQSGLTWPNLLWSTLYVYGRMILRMKCPSITLVCYLTAYLILVWVLTPFLILVGDLPRMLSKNVYMIATCLSWITRFPMILWTLFLVPVWSVYRKEMIQMMAIPDLSGSRVKRDLWSFPTLIKRSSLRRPPFLWIFYVKELFALSNLEGLPAGR